MHRKEDGTGVAYAEKRGKWPLFDSTDMDTRRDEKNWLSATNRNIQ